MAETTAGNCLQMHQPPAITHVTQTQHTRGQSYGKHEHVPIKVLSRSVLCGSTGRWGRRNAGLCCEREGIRGVLAWELPACTMPSTEPSGSEIWDVVRAGRAVTISSLAWRSLRIIVSRWQVSGWPFILQTYSNRKLWIIKDTTVELVVSCLV